MVTPVYDQVDNLLSAGYTGQGQIRLITGMSELSLTHVQLIIESGNTVLDILIGAVNPSGRLVVTW